MGIARGFDDELSLTKRADDGQAGIDRCERLRIGNRDEAQGSLVAAEARPRCPADQLRIAGFHAIFRTKREAALPMAEFLVRLAGPPQAGKRLTERKFVPWDFVKEDAVTLLDLGCVEVVSVTASSFTKSHGTNF